MAQETLLPALVAFLLVPELAEQALRVFTLPVAAIDFHAQVLQHCLLLGLLLRALFELPDRVIVLGAFLDAGPLL